MLFVFVSVGEVWECWKLGMCVVLVELYMWCWLCDCMGFVLLCGGECGSVEWNVCVCVCVWGV